MKTKLLAGPALVAALAVTATVVSGFSRTLEAQRPPQPAATGDIRVLPVQGNVYMLVAPQSNVAVQIGNDGVLVVDTMDAKMAPQLFAAIRTLTDKPIHTIVSTHVHADHTGGNGALVKLGSGGPQPVRVMAHENVQSRLLAATSAGGEQAARLRLNAVISLPVNDEYFTPSKDFFLNGEAIVLNHAPAAHTDGDTLVFFRRSDALSVGDVFHPDLYPFIDIQNGGSVQGLIDALNRILELTVPARYQEGGTYVIPGHGRLSDEAEVVEYRDMVTIVRDRVQDLMKKGQTLQQIKSARPSRDYDFEFAEPGGVRSADGFVEAIYRSLGGK